MKEIIKKPNNRSFESVCTTIVTPVTLTRSQTVDLNHLFGYTLSIEYEPEDDGNEINIILSPDETNKTQGKDFKIEIRMSRGQAKLIGGFLKSLSRMEASSDY